MGRSSDALNVVGNVLDWSRQIGAPRSEAIARQYLGLLLLEVELGTGHKPNLVAARTELIGALKLHEEVGFKQGFRETAVDLFELELHAGDLPAALAYLTFTDAYETAAVDPDTNSRIGSVLAEIEANGDRERAVRIRNTYDTFDR